MSTLLLPSQDKLDADHRQELDRVLAVNPVLDRAYRLKEDWFCRKFWPVDGFGVSWPCLGEDYAAQYATGSPDTD